MGCDAGRTLLGESCERRLNLTAQDLTAQESVRLAVAKIKILVGIVQKNVVVFDADGLAKTRLVAHLAADALRIGSRREYQGGGQCAGGSHDRERTHGLITLANDSRSARPPGCTLPCRGRVDRPTGPARSGRPDGRLRRAGWGCAE